MKKPTIVLLSITVLLFAYSVKATLYAADYDDEKKSLEELKAYTNILQEYTHYCGEYARKADLANQDIVEAHNALNKRDYATYEEKIDLYEGLITETRELSKECVERGEDAKKFQENSQYWDFNK